MRQENKIAGGLPDSLRIFGMMYANYRYKKQYKAEQVQMDAKHDQRIIIDLYMISLIICLEL